VFDVILTAAGLRGIQVIKVVRDDTGVSLKEAHDLVHQTPSRVGHRLSSADAQSLERRLVAAGASVEVRDSA
jgi:large subunit ribosomal protein L7/L12